MLVVLAPTFVTIRTPIPLWVYTVYKCLTCGAREKRKQRNKTGRPDCRILTWDKTETGTIVPSHFPRAQNAKVRWKMKNEYVVVRGMLVVNHQVVIFYSWSTAIRIMKWVSLLWWFSCNWRSSGARLSSHWCKTEWGNSQARGQKDKFRLRQAMCQVQTRGQLWFGLGADKKGKLSSLDVFQNVVAEWWLVEPSLVGP